MFSMFFLLSILLSHPLLITCDKSIFPMHVEIFPTDYYLAHARVDRKCSDESCNTISLTVIPSSHSSILLNSTLNLFSSPRNSTLMHNHFFFSFKFD